MTRTVGTSRPNSAGETSAISVLDQDGTVLLTFLDSAILDYKVGESGQCISYAIGELEAVAPVNLSGLDEGAPVEVALRTPGQPDFIAFRGTLSYVETASNKLTTVIEFEARGLASSLIDRPVKGALGPTLSCAVNQLAIGAGFSATLAHPDIQISAWVNAHSSYGALRLLATSLDAIIRTSDDTVEFVARDVYLARAAARPRLLLGSDQALSSHSIRGQRMKR